MESMKTIAKDFYSLIIIAKLSIIDIYQGFDYTSVKDHWFTGMTFHLTF